MSDDNHNYCDLNDHDDHRKPATAGRPLGPKDPTPLYNSANPRSAIEPLNIENVTNLQKTL